MCAKAQSLPRGLVMMGWGSPPQGACMISHIDHLVLTVSDIERAVAFYSRAFKMEPITFGEGRRALRFGNQKINLQLLGGGAAQPGSGGLWGSLPHHPLAPGSGDGPAREPGGRDSGGTGDKKRCLRPHRIGLLLGPGSEPYRDQPLSLSTSGASQRVYSPLARSLRSRGRKVSTMPMKSSR